MTTLIELAPAKINLSLHVGPPKANGRHDLTSLVVFADETASDRLSSSPATGFSLGVEGPHADASGPAQDNLVLRAARTLNEILDGNAPPLAFRLVKNLPCAAGIGGGSADAGAALRLLIRAHGGENVLEAARKVAPHLGGDVLACLTGVAGIMRGEGEIYEPLMGIPPLCAVLVNPNVPCPTGTVFRAYDDTAPPHIPDHPMPPAGRARGGSFTGWLGDHTENSLEQAAINLVPEIGDVLSTLANADNARLVRMSGSGATCFALFDDMQTANIAATEIASQCPGWWVCATRLGGG